MVGALHSLARRARRIPHRARELALHDHDEVFASLRRRLEELQGDLHTARLLDFGCGYKYPFVAMLRSLGADVTGLEVAPVFRDGALAHLRACGGLRKPGTTVEGYLLYQESAAYFRTLERERGLRVDHAACNLLQYAGERVPFEDRSFDGILSNAVLQELPTDAPGGLGHFAGEMARVLRPGGWIDLEWHSFYSWSGHYLGADECRRNPWGHLRGGRAHPCLNRVTPDAVREAFAPHFTALRLVGHDQHHRLTGDPDFEPEGREYLTPEVREELAAYPEEWLLTRGYILQGRKPPC